MVQQDQIVIDFPENNVQANFHQAKAAFDLAEQTLERIQRLFETGGISQQELDGAETQFKVAQANWDAVQQAVHVQAPFRGMITDMNVREFQRVTPGDYLFTVAQLTRMHGRIWVNEDDIHSINRNSRATFIWNNVERPARITNIALSKNRDFNAFAVDIEIDNADYAIRSGVTGTAIVYIYENPRAIVVPMNIVQRDLNGQSYVYVAAGGVAQRRNVTVNNQSELSLEIIEGLNVGDRLIIQGLQLVSEGSRLNVQE
jgi:membrane fusion protein (multidrug efflux system)